jgi:hypothetical protein
METPMHYRRKNERFLIAVFSFWILTSGCAASHFLSVTYELPPASGMEMHRTIRLNVTDARDPASFLSPAAQDALGSVSDTLNLAVKGQSQPTQSVGAYSLIALVKQVIERRLEQDGIKIASEGQKNQPELAIELRKFWLDLINRRWTLTITYGMALLKDGKPLSQETISGQAERLDIVGRKDAELLIGDLLSDLANRIKPDQLLQKAEQ